ncbi:MAG: Re/Si-specific NAD(P)(+) transhydrogenase subunit alpha [Verrucomicrobiota bacterium]
MKLFAPKETCAGERRVALVPAAVARLVKLGAEVEVEAGLGKTLRESDAAYTEAGATISHDRRASLGSADMVLRLHKPPVDEVGLLKQGAIHVSYLDPFNDRPLLEALAAAGVSAICMEMIPRSTLAQKMDALSSQANLAGYLSVVLAAGQLGRILPMMMTPSGTIPPARVFVIGVGVAGLQAIATAKRLGARVEAFDTRPVVEEQVQSLGAKFVKVDLGEMGETKQGYAKQLTEEQLEKQRQVMAKHCAQSDIVITTAQLFGRPAPVIVTDEMVRGMRPGSLLVDLAVETGGNVEGSKVDEVVEVEGVRILGYSNLPGHAAVPASEMYASNLANLIEHFWDKDEKCFRMDPADELQQGCLLTHGGAIIHESFKPAASDDAS